MMLCTGAIYTAICALFQANENSENTRSLKMLRNFQSPTATIDRQVKIPSWPERALDWASGRPWWTDPNRSRRAIAQLSDDRLSELSEVGRRIRQGMRRQHVCLQCKENAMTTLSISNVAIRPRRRSSKFMKAIIATIDAFHEALEMRRAAHRKYPFFDE